MKILVTGGAGYIGSHTLIELYAAGHTAVVVDNLSNSNPESLRRVAEIIGVDGIPFYQIDIRDKAGLESVFAEHKFDACIHFAGLKAVGESVAKPLMYYENNLLSTIVLIKTMEKYGVNNFVFSSSATVYGSPKSLPIEEDFPLSTTNPYGTTKLFIERIIEDVCVANPNFSAVVLRYFNPIGAHKSGLIGENPVGIPNNLMPYIVRVADKQLKELSVFGNDYDTHDGTGVRDYIHVVDLAKGHLKAIEKADKSKGVLFYNLGTGTGYSVLDLVETFKRVNNVDVPYKIVDRRPGDIAACYADPKKAYEELVWKAERGIDEMCRDSYNYILKSREK